MSVLYRASPRSARRIALSAVWLLGISLAFPSSALALQGAPPKPVGVSDVKTESVQNQQMVTGELRAVHRSRVASEEPGVVAEMPVLEGQVVEQGDVLAVLDRRRLELELAQMEADLSVASGVISERQADLEMAQNDVEAVRAVFEQRAANAKEMRDAESRLRWAQARVTQAERSVEAIEAQRDLLTKRLEDMTIVAPYAGIVVARHVEVGEWLAEGNPVVDLISTGAIEAWVNVPQSLYTTAGAKGLAIGVKIEATGQLLSTNTKRVIPQVDPRARTFTLAVTLPNEDRGLAPGMSVVAWVPMGEAEERTTVASDAIMRNETGEFVYAVRQLNPEGPAQAVPVKVRVLHPHGSRTVVDAGELAAGEQVIVEGNERLFPFAPVVPVEAPVVSSRDAAQGAIE
jgi:RND family efflux transporter MFP subunit